MASGVQSSKDDHRPKAPLTKSTSLNVGVKPKHRGTGCSSTSKSSGGSVGVSALMLREMEDLRNLSIGSPVPAPRADDDDSLFANAFDDESFPAIRIDRCSTSIDASQDVKQAEDRTRNGRPSDDLVTTISPHRSASSHAKSDQRWSCAAARKFLSYGPKWNRSLTTNT